MLAHETGAPFLVLAFTESRTVCPCVFAELLSTSGNVLSHSPYIRTTPIVRPALPWKVSTRLYVFVGNWPPATPRIMGPAGSLATGAAAVRTTVGAPDALGAATARVRASAPPIRRG